MPNSLLGEAVDERKEERLAANVGRARTPDRVAAAVESWVGYLLQTAQHQRAQTVVEQYSAQLLDSGDRGDARLALLRAKVSVAALDAVAGYAFVSRALSETVLTETDRAELHFAAAHHAILLGMWQAARGHLVSGFLAASRNRTQRRFIAEFAQRFSLRLPQSR